MKTRENNELKDKILSLNRNIFEIEQKTPQALRPKEVDVTKNEEYIRMREQLKDLKSDNKSLNKTIDSINNELDTMCKQLQKKNTENSVLTKNNESNQARIKRLEKHNEKLKKDKQYYKDAY